MRKLFGLFLTLSVSISVFGQGVVIFNNRVPGIVDVRLVLPDGSGAGAGWKAQLVVSRSGGRLEALNPTTTFRSSSAAAAGYVEPINVTVPNAQSGSAVTLQVRAFTGASFDSSPLRYESNPFTVTLGGGTLPPANLEGLREFRNVPQQSPPIIVLQPQSQNLVAGGSATFRVEVSGTGPFTYQWLKNDQSIAGATQSSYTIAKLSESDAGRYSVRVSNAAGSVTSQEAILSLPLDLDSGVLVFNNRIPGLVDARVLLPNGTAAGEGWTAQLYAGLDLLSLKPLVPTTTFRTTSAATLGYVNQVEVKAPGLKPGTRATVVMRVYNGKTFEDSPTRLESNPITVTVGGGTLPPANLIGLQTFKEVGAAPVPSFVKRQLPSGYAPGVRLTVTLQAAPPSATTVYAVEDQPPNGWTVGRVSDDGRFDSNTGKVKFGPFFDRTSRSLSYDVTPPSRESGPKTFAGASSADGRSSSIEGDTTISVVAFHPADQNPSDFRITIDEATAYGAAWRRGATWAVSPNPIPIDYVTRAGTLWKNGETYTVDSRVNNPPLWWVNRAVGGSAGGQRKSFSLAAASHHVVRHVRSGFVPGEPLPLLIAVNPGAGASVYALEEQVPAGWAVGQVSHGGELDAVNGLVKWGPFFDAQERQITYELIPPVNPADTISFEGTASFDGVGVAVAGRMQSRISSRLGTVQRSAQGQIQLSVRARPGAKVTVQVSNDLLTWTDLESLTNTDGTVVISDREAAAKQFRFYRAVVP